MKHLLIVDDDVASCRMLQLHFGGAGFSVTLAHSVDEAFDVAEATPPDAVILDIRMPGTSGLEALPRFKERYPGAPVVMITAFHDMDSTVQAMKMGADDYIHKPVNIDELDTALSAALVKTKPEDGLMSFGQDCSPADRNANIMVGRSRGMRDIFKTIGLVSQSRVNVLIYGESGTGKELVARAIHNAGPEPAAPFVAVNCAALVETLLESDLFGHEKGAFTGAVRRQPGKFELAENGTILLDEVSELSAATQAKLLRVLQEREYMPVGGHETRSTSARVIAATNIDLLDLVHKGDYREDLYYRLKVVTVRVPPLRERREDLPDLVNSLLTRVNREMRRQVYQISSEVMDAFYAYEWPGNVRELENLLMKAVALCTRDRITIDLIPQDLRLAAPSNPMTMAPQIETSLDGVEKKHVERILAATDWHKGRTCEILGISRPRLQRLIQKYDLTPDA